jgi:hypothetical protein
MMKSKVDPRMIFEKYPYIKVASLVPICF